MQDTVALLFAYLTTFPKILKRAMILVALGPEYLNS